MEEVHIQMEQSWRANASDKWDTIDSGKWVQKSVWNRMVTTSERDQFHKTPVTSTWTTDFLTREGEVLKAMGDWLRDKTVHWKAHRRFLQTNTVTFPCVPQDISRVVCEDSKSQWSPLPTMSVSNRYKMTLGTHTR